MDIERMNKPKVAVGMLFKEEMIFRDMMKAALRFYREPDWVFYFQTRIQFVDLARNVVASQALKSGAEYLFFWDSDIVVPPDVVPRLMAYGLPVVSGLYWRRHPQIFPEAFRVNSNGITEPMSLEEIHTLKHQTQPIECDAVGLGCCLIHKSVLEKLAKRSDRFRMISPDDLHEPIEVIQFMKFIMQNHVTVSEDVHFCWRVKHELGYKIFVDLNIECQHLTGAQVSDGKLGFSALAYTKE
jgi:hypothetical protein